MGAQSACVGTARVGTAALGCPVERSSTGFFGVDTRPPDPLYPLWLIVFG
jgi:hypothetical protein